MHTPFPLQRPLAVALLALAATAASAQTVTIYGSLDAGIGYVDNVQGRSLTRLDSGALYANRLGYRGTEDLGGGLQAVFVLEGGFNVDDGSISLGGRGFGRQSYVGIGSRSWGTLTLGRQYDLLYAGSPLPLDVGALLIGGLAGASGGAGTAVDNHSGGVRYDNAVKWQGRFGAWTLGAMHGKGSENGSDRMWSAALSYRAGPVWAGVGWVKDDFSAAASGNQVVLAGLNWDVVPGQKLVLTASRAEADLPSDRVSRSDMLQLGWVSSIGGLWTVGATLGHADTRNSRLEDGRIRQVGAGAQYLLSKRSTVYAIASRVSSSGSAGTAYSGVPGVGAPAASLRSSDGQQQVWRLGLLHKF